MTGQASDALWAGVGRLIDALSDDLTDQGWDVTVVWDRPRGQVGVVVKPGPAMSDRGAR